MVTLLLHVVNSSVAFCMNQLVHTCRLVSHNVHANTPPTQAKIIGGGTTYRTCRGIWRRCYKLASHPLLKHPSNPLGRRRRKVQFCSSQSGNLHEAQNPASLAFLPSRARTHTDPPTHTRTRAHTNTRTRTLKFSTTLRVRHAAGREKVGASAITWKWSITLLRMRCKWSGVRCTWRRVPLWSSAPLPKLVKRSKAGKCGAPDVFSKGRKCLSPNKRWKEKYTISHSRPASWIQ